MKLPPQLAPWRAWLSLLPPDLAAPLGAMLLRLQPLVGRMARVAAPVEDIPSGSGTLARRGPYQRLLLSQWAVLDAAPDEFIRRAAANELLFSAPEPQVQRRARLCVALFDAGPEQLGEPRLAQLALFILLARRAFEAGHSFEWGILQAPGALHAQSGREALLSLLAARTVARAGAPHLAGWNAALAGFEDGTEVWQLGPPGAAVLERTCAQAAIDQPLDEAHLDVTIMQKGGTRRLQLALPPARLGARLLVDPFKPAPRPRRGPTSVASADCASRLFAPRFGVRGDWIVAARRQGGSVLHAVPNSLSGQAGKMRRYRHTRNVTELGVVLFGKVLARVVRSATHLTFMRFPDHAFGPPLTVALPSLRELRTPPDQDCWLPTFFLPGHAPSGVGARVFMVDLDHRLVCWTAAGRKLEPQVRFDRVADRVVGAAQVERTLLYARSEGQRTTLYRLRARASEPETIAEFAFASMQVLFGVAQEGRLFAIQLSHGEWRVVDGNATRRSRILIPHGARVVGVTRGRRPAAYAPGLVVLETDRCTVNLYSRGDKRAILRTSAPIAQLTLDPAGTRLCWVTGAPELGVMDIDSEGDPLLRVIEAPARESA